MAATTTHLMTVEEFSDLPKDDGPVYHELHHGEIVAVPRAKYKHYFLQSRLRDELRAVAPPGGLVEIEFAFRALPEYELRVADIAYVPTERKESIDPDNYLQGAPDLVIEVLSPSNKVAELYEREKLCLENGAQEFWIIDQDRRQVKVSTPDGRTITYTSGSEIPLTLFGGAKLAVDTIFR